MIHDIGAILPKKRNAVSYLSILDSVEEPQQCDIGVEKRNAIMLKRPKKET
jgi:hypothetical protein